MAADQIAAIISSFTPIAVIRILALGILIVHLGFSIVLVRQTKLMIKVVEAQISPLIDFISILHLMFSFFVFIWALLIL